jgi:hypothetical protein
MWRWWHTAIWFLFVIVMPWLAYRNIGHPVGIWWMFMAGFVLVLMLTGHGITGSWKGAFVDNRNVMSLSRLQMIAWSILVLSAFTVAVFWNLFMGNGLESASPDGGFPELPQALWLLMGISTASMVGSPLILNGKKEQPADERERSKTFELLSQQGYDTGQMENQGQLVLNQTPDQARWSDLFTGEEVGNFARLDLARLQMLFFTMISLLTYGVAIGHLLASRAAIGGGSVIESLPALSEGLVALVGISHTGYLAAKATSNSQTGRDKGPESAGTI